MEENQMEMDEIESNNDLEQPIYRRRQSKKLNSNLLPTKNSVYAILLSIAFILVLLIFFGKKNKENSISIEKNEKNGEKIEEDTCEPGYKLKDGKCEINYSIKAIYKIFKDDDIITLINSIKSEQIKEMIVEGKKVEPSNKYLFPKKGRYEVFFLLDDYEIDSLSHMFEGNIHLESVSFSELFNTEKITKMDNMFKNCKSLIEVDLSKFNTKNVVIMDFMFFGCNSLLTLDLSNFTNDNLVSMKRMFFQCSALQSINLKNFKTPKVEDMSYAFANCNTIKTLDLSSFDTTNVKNMRGMFERCKSLFYVNIRNFNTENVEDMAYMFNKCYSLISVDTENFYAPKVKSIDVSEVQKKNK